MDPALKNLLLALALYVSIAAALLAWVWWCTSRSPSLARRAWFRALAVSCLFSPTVFALFTSVFLCFVIDWRSGKRAERKTLRHATSKANQLAT